MVGIKIFAVTSHCHSLWFLDLFSMIPWQTTSKEVTRELDIMDRLQHEQKVGKESIKRISVMTICWDAEQNRSLDGSHLSIPSKIVRTKTPASPRRNRPKVKDSEHRELWWKTFFQELVSPPHLNHRHDQGGVTKKIKDIASHFYLRPLELDWPTTTWPSHA